MFKYGKCLCVYAFVWGRGGCLILGKMRKSNRDSAAKPIVIQLLITKIQKINTYDENLMCLLK
jgi:hypothetical protein